MAGRSFAINTARDFYDKLLEDYKAYIEDPTSSGLAINVALPAWHLSEWLYWENIASLITTYPSDTIYQLDLRTNLCPDLEIMRSIANGSKHCVPPGSNQRVQGTSMHIGDFSREFSREFDTTCLLINLDDGTEVDFEDVLENVMNFWKSYVTTQFGWVL